jgi:hypothetical protein
MRKVRTLVLLAVAAVAPGGLSGCVIMPLSMGIFTPIPVQPWVTERMLEKYQYKNDFRTPVLPPIREGFPPPLCEDPPDEEAVLRAMPHVVRGIPYFYEEFRDDISIVTERLVDKIDPPRFFPLLGPAQLHHCHWKCTMYYTETIESTWPFPFRTVKPRVQVIYMDKDHFHMYTCPTPEAQRAATRDLVGY